jgi:hypothetical protein
VEEEGVRLREIKKVCREKRREREGRRRKE